MSGGALLADPSSEKAASSPSRLQQIRFASPEPIHSEVIIEKTIDSKWRYRLARPALKTEIDQFHQDLESVVWQIELVVASDGLIESFHVYRGSQIEAFAVNSKENKLKFQKILSVPVVQTQKPGLVAQREGAIQRLISTASPEIQAINKRVLEVLGILKAPEAPSVAAAPEAPKAEATPTPAPTAEREKFLDMLDEDIEGPAKVN